MKASPIVQSNSESTPRIDPLRPGQPAGAPPARDPFAVQASLAFIDYWERATILGAMMQPTPAAGALEGAVDEARHRPPASAARPTAKPSWSAVTLVLIGFGVLLALLALCGSR